jgi:hypothetical protein
MRGGFGSQRQPEAGRAHSSGIPALRRPMKKVASYRARIFGTPKYRPAFRLAMVG